MTLPICFLDFETRSKAQLVGKNSVGASRYCQDPSTEILCCAYAFGNGEPQLWVMDQKPPRSLMRHIENGGTISGWNSMSFERSVFKYIAGPRLGWKVPRLEQFIDTMHDALGMGLPATLEQCAEVTEVVEKKDTKGKKLIQKLCKPIANGKNKGKFRSRQAFAKDFADLYTYCKQDVRTERAIYQWLPRHVKGSEREIQLLTARMNERGVPIDVETVESIVYTLDLYTDEMNARCVELTGYTGTQVAELTKFLDMPNIQKATVEKYLRRSKLDPVTREVLEIRQRVSKSSTAKFRKMLLQVCEDGRIRDNLIYHKASTGRYAGAGVQLQNLPRETIAWVKYAIKLFKEHDLEAIKLFGEPMKVASALIRAMVCAPPGMKLMDSDLSKIEAICTAWVALEEDILEAHRQGLDNYKVSAAKMYGVSYHDVDKEQRQVGKVAELSGGFGGGAPAIMRGAEQAGLQITEKTAEGIKKVFRKTRKKLVACWYSFGNAAMRAVMHRGVTIPVKHNPLFQLRYEGNFLYMALPSGRWLPFPFPKVMWGTWKNKRVILSDEKRDNSSRQTLTSMWVNSETKKWERRGLIGANLFQSAVQAIARDILMQAHLRIEEDGFPLIMSVHDESVSMVKDSPEYTLERYNHLMSIPLDWTGDMPIRAEGWEGQRYKKD